MKLKLEADLHTHTIASGHAFATVKEMAEYAAIKNLKMIAITDHGLNMPGGPHEYYFYKLIELPRFIDGVEILRGVEANIIDEKGNLDMPENILENLDIVLAGFHSDTGYQLGSLDQNTRALIGAMQNPYVDIIAHPGNPKFPVDLEKIAHAAKMTGKVLEINNSSFTQSRPGSLPRCTELAKAAARLGNLVAINSDAHNCFEVGDVNKALEVARIAGLKKEQIINTSTNLVKDFINKTRKRNKKIS